MFDLCCSTCNYKLTKTFQYYLATAMVHWIDNRFSSLLQARLSVLEKFDFYVVCDLFLAVESSSSCSTAFRKLPEIPCLEVLQWDIPFRMLYHTAFRRSNFGKIPIRATIHLFRLLKTIVCGELPNVRACRRTQRLVSRRTTPNNFSSCHVRCVRPCYRRFPKDIRRQLPLLVCDFAMPCTCDSK